MKLLKALLGVAALIGPSFALPLIDLERTSLTLDNSKTALDRGELVLHLTRVDDLLGDDQTLLLEKQTHIGLQIQLDAAAGVVDVNGNKLPLINRSADEQGLVAVKVVKAESYTLPTELPAAFYSPEHVQSLVESISEGIVAVRVRIDSEIVAEDDFAFGDELVEDDAVLVQPIVGTSLRKIGLFVAIDEVEGKEFKHSKEIYTPILQLLASTKLGPNGLEIAKVTTLSVGGTPAAPDAVHSLDTLPQIDRVIPTIPTKEQIAEAKDAQDHLRQMWTHNKPHVGGIFNWLKAIFEQPKYAGAQAMSKVGKPCPGRVHFQDGKAVANEAPRFGHQGLRGVRKGHGLAHLNDIVEERKQHHRLCFLGRIRKGFNHAGLFFVRHFHEMYVLQAFLAVLFFGALFKTIRGNLKRKRAQQALIDGPPSYDDLDDLPYGEEKLYAVYVEVPSNEATPVFDAEYEDINALDQMRAHAEKF